MTHTEKEARLPIETYHHATSLSTCEYIDHSDELAHREHEQRSTMFMEDEYFDWKPVPRVTRTRYTKYYLNMETY